MTLIHIKFTKISFEPSFTLEPFTVVFSPVKHKITEIFSKKTTPKVFLKNSGCVRTLTEQTAESYRITRTTYSCLVDN